MILHTLNAGPDSEAFNQCLRTAAGEDAILLTGDAVYASIHNTIASNLLVESGAELYVLESDALAAGIQTKVCEPATVIDYNGFVELSERFARQLAWY
ncbi:MAG: tRNA 2-thiouridine synthesizing protein B [Halioglobus sp.]